MKKLLVYPFNIDTLPLVRYCELLPDYCEIVPVVEGGAGTVLAGSDVSSFDFGSHYGLEISTDFENEIKRADSVFFNCGIHNLELAKSYFRLAKDLGKHIIVSRSVLNDLDINDGECELFTHSMCEYEVEPQFALAKIPVPVILVMGQGQLCNKFDIQLGLRKKFLDMEYSISQVGTKEYSPLFGFGVLPNFADAPLWKKILLYNRYFKEIVDNENPDVLIVGIPGGIMPIDEWHNEMFGETAIAISKSLNPDTAILSMYQFPLNDNDLAMLKDYAKHALGVTLEYFHVSNNKLIFEQDMRTINYLFVDSETVLADCNQLREAKEIFFNVHMNSTSARAYENIILDLQNNIEIL